MKRRQWNLDIIGVEGVEAEAELLAAMITFFERAGLGPQDVGVKARACAQPWPTSALGPTSDSNPTERESMIVSRSRTQL